MQRLRRSVSVVLIAAVCSAMVVSCADDKAHARDEFITQLITEGGLDRPQATCVVDKFFATRGVEELKRFFARKDLTEAERADFAAIAKACIA